MIYEKIKASALTTAYLAGICLLTTVITGILLVLSNSSDYVLMIPFLSAFLHGSVEHALMNLLVIFLLMLIKDNYFGVLKIYYYSTIIYIIYIPLILLGFPVSIGLSGFVFFLLSRSIFLATINWNATIKNIVAISILSYELVQIKNPDGISHGSHSIGFLFGLFILYKEDILDLLRRRPN